MFTAPKANFKSKLVTICTVMISNRNDDDDNNGDDDNNDDDDNYNDDEADLIKLSFCPVSIGFFFRPFFSSLFNPSTSIIIVYDNYHY